MNTQTIELDLSKEGGDQYVTIGQGDKSGTTIEARVYDNGAPVSLSGSDVHMVVRLPDKSHYARLSATASGNVVTCVVDEEKAASVAGYTDEAYFTVAKGGAVYSTERFALDIKRSALDGMAPAESWDSDIDELIESIENQKKDQAADFDAAQAKRADEFAAAEKARGDAEKERATAENGRGRAESARATAEDERTEAEADRAAAESSRVTSESSRVLAESSRATAEAGRVSDEAARATAESSRATAEGARKSSETARQTAERARVAAEAERVTQQAKNNADQALNNAAMAKLAPYICGPGEYDAATLMPTVAGEANRMYYVPSEQGPGNRYVEWMLIDGAWEMMGVSSIEISPITTGQIDQVAADQAPTGEDVLNLTGLSYLWAKLKALFAPKSHAAAATTHGAASASLYGHAKASQTTPLANGTAALGSETASFARGDHRHPAQTTVTGNAGTATKLATARSIALAGDLSGSASFDGSADASITAAIKALAVKAGMIADGAVTGAKIAAASVSRAKLDASLAQDIADLETAWDSVSQNVSSVVEAKAGYTLTGVAYLHAGSLHYQFVVTSAAAREAGKAYNVCQFKPAYRPLINSPTGGLLTAGHTGTDGNIIAAPVAPVAAGGKMYVSGSFILK